MQGKSLSVCDGMLWVCYWVLALPIATWVITAEPGLFSGIAGALGMITFVTTTYVMAGLAVGRLTGRDVFRLLPLGRDLGRRLSTAFEDAVGNKADTEKADCAQGGCRQRVGIAEDGADVSIPGLDGVAVSTEQCSTGQYMRPAHHAVLSPSFDGSRTQTAMPVKLPDTGQQAVG